MYVDGGLRHGLDVLAALALGARAVFLGRPALWALATGGAPGVARLLETLAEELSEGLRLVGSRRCAQPDAGSGGPAGALTGDR